MPNYKIAPDGKSITCSRCGRQSYNRYDVVNRYCGLCHLFLEENMISKQRVELTIKDKTVQGVIVMGSENLKSLMIGLDDPAAVSGGVYLNMLPLLLGNDGEYQDLIHGDVVKVEWLDKPNEEGQQS